MEWGCIIEDASILTLTLTLPCREVAVISLGRRDSVSCVIWWGEKHNNIDLHQEPCYFHVRTTVSVFVSMIGCVTGVRD